VDAAVRFIDGDSREQISLLPACVDDYVAPDALVGIVDAFVAGLDLANLGFNRSSQSLSLPPSAWCGPLPRAR
jgi:hypothetical protein